jgi:hexokinase
MQEIRKKVHKFLQRNGMEHRRIPFERAVREFLAEMERGLGGIPSSLQMIPTHIDVEQDIPLEKPVIVLDAGGTHFRVASVCFQRDGRPVIENYEKFPMPGTLREISRADFFSTIAGYMSNVLECSSRIGFCFSYPAEILPNKDGRLLEFSKEIKAPEVVGQLIGGNLISAIRSAGYRGEEHVVILNDTVATLLAGRAAHTKRVFDTYIGFILGTGTNCCYIEANSRITKCPELDSSRSQIINLEAGNFGKAPRGRIDREFDSTMINPGQYTFEKMISGAYFGALCLRTLHEAAGEKALLSPAMREALSGIERLETREVNEFLQNPVLGDTSLALAASAGNECDRTALFYLIDGLIQRAAKLTAVALSAVIIKSRKGKDPCRPVCITAEGSTFYGLRNLKSRIDCYLHDYLTEKKGYHYEILNVENATLIGAAIAGLTN